MTQGIEVASRRVRCRASLDSLPGGRPGQHTCLLDAGRHLGSRWSVGGRRSGGHGHTRCGAAVVVVLLVAAVLVVLARVGLWQQAIVSDRVIRFFAWALAAVFLLETVASFTWSRGEELWWMYGPVSLVIDCWRWWWPARAERGPTCTGRTERCPLSEGDIMATRTLPVTAPAPVEPVGDGAVIARSI